MLAPLSWLKDYIDITQEPKTLGDRLTEIGLGTEKITFLDNKDTLFEFEITPNRPDLLSIIGIAREIAAIENKPLRYPKTKLDVTKAKPKNKFPLTIKTDPLINPRFTGIIIDGVTVKDSPQWLQERLLKIGQRPINNIVDITNYVMFELGNPLHAFDYNKIKEHIMIVEQAKGGEVFKSVDGVSYHLPKGAVIIKDGKDIIDLCGIKGGYNSGTFADTKTIFIRVPVEIPNLIRRTSLALGLRSEASSIFERAVNAGGTIDALKRASGLILELAGGTVASDLYDIKKDSFTPWKLSLRLERLHYILGIEIKEEKVLSILQHLNLSPVKKVKNAIDTTIPTYRNDLKIEEDLIEEVARIYGYNNFPKTLPVGQIPTQQIPYFKNYKTDEKVKQLLKASGFSEIYTYSLISEIDLKTAGINANNVIRVDNPVSRDFEYLRPTLHINLQKALQQNKPFAKDCSLFELGKVYLGKNLNEAKEAYYLSGITNSKSFFEIKGILEKLFSNLGIHEDSTQYITILDEGIFFEMNFQKLLENMQPANVYTPIPKYPPIIEDLALLVKPQTKIGDLIKAIKKLSKIIADVSLFDVYDQTRTFRIIYQHPEKNLTNEEVSTIRLAILKHLKEKFNVTTKE